METIKRTYLETHPWLTFNLNLEQAPFTFWMLMAEAQAKCEYLVGVPLQPQIARNLNSLYLAKGALATTAIEGNTLSEEEVLKRIEGKLDLPPSKEYLGQEIDNILEACNLILGMVLEEDTTNLTAEDIKLFNNLILQDLPLDSAVIPGEIRQHRSVVGPYRAAPPEDCKYLLYRLVDWLNDGFGGPGRYAKAFGILKAIIGHLYLAWIHPFGDGNGRTARLLEFQILLASGLTTPAAHLLSNHYNSTRSEYYRHLNDANKDELKVLQFIEYALTGFIDGLDEQMNMVRRQQLNVHWRDYVYEVFRNRSGSVPRRRRRLVLDLSEKTIPLPISEIRHVSARTAENYAGKTDKTVRRDVKKLIEMDLLTETEAGVKVNRDLMRGFMPQVKTSSE